MRYPLTILMLTINWQALLLFFYPGPLLEGDIAMSPDAPGVVVSVTNLVNAISQVP